MPEVQPSKALEPRSALFWDGTYWRMATVDALGHLQIDVLSMVMDADAATEATLASAEGYLGLIAALWNCLRSVHTDRLMVKGEDQVFSIEKVIADTYSGIISGADGHYDSGVVPDDRYWVLTNVLASDFTSPTTAHYYITRHDGASRRFDDQRAAFVADEYSSWHGHVYLDQGDLVRVEFVGGQAGDSCRLYLTGYQMTTET